MPVKAPVPVPPVPYTYVPFPRWVISKIAQNPDGTQRKVVVNTKEEEAYHTGVMPEDVVIERAPDPEPPPVYKPIPYPRSVRSQHRAGEKVIVKNHIEEEYHTGIPVNEDGTPITDESVPVATMPPTLEVVMAAGYSKEDAVKIVAEEQRKFSAGEKPYGDKEPAAVVHSGQPDDADF